MFGWFKKRDNLDEQVLFQNRLIQGLHESIAFLQNRTNEMGAIIAALLLKNGSTEYTIKQEFFDKFAESEMDVVYEISPKGDLELFLVKKEDLEDEEE